MTHHPRRRRYQHAEAYCLLTYQAVDGSGDREVVFNSRDGVTPFVISLRDGREARHVMALAVRRPDFVPPPGSRIFVDLTADRARALAEHNVAGWWRHPELGPMARERWGSQAEMVAVIAADYTRLPGAPDLIEVPPAPKSDLGERVRAAFAGIQVEDRPLGDRIPGRDA